MASASVEGVLAEVSRDGWMVVQMIWCQREWIVGELPRSCSDTDSVSGYAAKQAEVDRTSERPHARAAPEPAYGTGIRGLDHSLYPISRHSPSR